MILRSIGARHGRTALSTPIARASLRRLTTENGPRLGGRPRSAEAQSVENVGDLHRRKQRLRDVIRPVGSNVEIRHEHNPQVSPSNITLEALMAAQTHMGHHASLWNPANSRYIYGVRQGIHIISLETTAAHLRRAAKVVEEVSYRGGLVLIAGTRKGQMEIVTQAAKEAKACYLFTKWTPGSITNRDIILRDRFIEIVDENDQILPGFDKHIPQSRPLVPDLVVCLNPLENYTLLYECGLAGIPTIGVIDTDADPSWVTYTIPANDDSLRSTGLIASVLGQAGKYGQTRRLAEAKDGNVTWQTPQDITQFIKGMTAQREEIISSLASSQMDGGTEGESAGEGLLDGQPEGHPGPPPDAYEQSRREAAATKPDAAVVPNWKKATATVEDWTDADMERESQELFKEMSESAAEVDGMAAIEKEILAMFEKEKAAVTEQAIMSGVGVEQGVQEDKAEANPVEKQVEAALASAEAEASIAKEQLKHAAATAAQAVAPKEAQAAASSPADQEMRDALAKAHAQVKLLEEQLKRGKDE